MRYGSRVFGLAAATLIGACLSALGFDFRLREHRVPSLDGDSVDHYFQHEDSRIFYRLPRGWTHEESETQFVARPPLPSRGRLVIQVMPPFPKLPAPGTKEGIDEYRKHFLEHLPAGATDPKEEETEVIRLGGGDLPATRSTFSYSWSGRPRGYTVIYVAFRPDLWVVIRIDSLKEDFASVRARALGSLEGFTEAPAAAAPASPK